MKHTLEKRHPITHNLGIVDRKYLEKVRTSEAEGRDVNLDEEEVIIALDTVLSLICGVHAGLYPSQFNGFAIEGSAIWRAGVSDSRIRDLHFQRLEVNDKTTIQTARADSDVEPFYTKEIRFTNFPLDCIDIRAAFDGEHWTLYLPSEH